MFWIILLSTFALHASEPSIIGVGEPIIDLIYQVDEEFLMTHQEEKGGSRKIEYAQFLHYKQLLEPQAPKIVPGGCCGNTIKGLSRLGIQSRFVGKVGCDHSGNTYLNSLIKYNVLPLLVPSSTHTTQLLSLVTPDSQRTMRCCFGASNELTPEELVPEQFEGTTHLILEGYFLYNISVVKKAISLAKERNATISIDLACFEVVRSFKEQILHMLDHDIDVVFANEDEARELTGLPPEEACYALQKRCPIAVILVGKEGCFVGSGDQIFKVAPPTVTVVDTTGAGDLFSSGFLYGYLRGLPLQRCAELGNLLGSTCIQSIGAEIPEEKWLEIQQEL